MLEETLPWHITYEGFEGTLPDIGAIQLLFAEVGFRIINIPIVGNCDYHGNADAIAEPGAPGWTLFPDPTTQFNGVGNCPDGVFEAAESPITILEAEEPVTFSLI